MNEFDKISDKDLEARCDDLYTQIMGAFDSLPVATWTPEYRAARRDIQANEIQFRAVCIELSRRLDERAARWNEIVDVIVSEDCEHPATFIYGCPCGGDLDWCDDATAATCDDCGTVHTSTSALVRLPHE